MTATTVRTTVLWTLTLVIANSRVAAQSRIRLPGDDPTTVIDAYQPGSQWTPGPMGPTYAPVPAPPALSPQIQPFDPYSTPLQSPGLTGAPAYGTTPPGYISVPSTSVPGAAAPTWTFPQPTLPPASPTWPGPATFPPTTTLPPASTPPALPSQFGQVPGYPTTPVAPWTGPPPPVTPTPVFPDGLPWQQPERLFQDTGAVYTYLYGDDGPTVSINEIDIFTTMVLKYFAHTGSGLRVTPGFTFDFLSGPSGVDADLPPQLYAAYLNTGWNPQITPQFSGDLNFRVGVYSDFETVTSHSIRFIGRGLGVVQVTPTMAFKLGVEYLDRARIKLLPAGGILWEPNPQTRCDIYFPRPRLSRYWKTEGNTDYWWHVGAEYGGGSWTIDREDAPLLGASDRIDLNDIRVFIGMDWDRLNSVDGLLQVGYVFNRELVYTLVPSESMDLDDTFMVRLGLQF